MDTLTAASIVLVFTTIAFAALADRQRRRAEALQTQIDTMAARSQAQQVRARDEGLFTGVQRGWGMCYAAACTALRDGRDPAEAVLAVRAILKPTEANWEGADAAPLPCEPYYTA